MVRKSPNRTLRVTVRPTRPAGPQPGGHGVGESHQLAVERRPAVVVAGEGLLVPDRLQLALRLHRAVVDARWPARGGGGPWPARARRPASPPGGPPRSPTVVTPRRSSRASVAGPTPHRACTGSGCRNASSSPGSTTTTPAPGRTPVGDAFGLAASEASLASELRRRHPDRAGQAPPRRRPWRRMSAAIAGAEPNRRRAPADVEEGLVERDGLHERRVRTGRCP